MNATAQAADKAKPAEKNGAPAFKEIDYSKPVGLDALQSPTPLTWDGKKGLQPGFEFRIPGKLDGVVKRMRALPNGFMELLLAPKAMPGQPADVWKVVLITQAGIICDVTQEQT